MFILGFSSQIILTISKLNPLMHNIPKQTHFKNLAAKSCKIFKVCLTILEHYALKGEWLSKEIHIN